MAFNGFIRTDDRVIYPIADGSACDQGDFMMSQSGVALKMAAVSDAKDFIGIADEKKVASDGKVTVAVIAPNQRGKIFRGSLDAATTVAVGDKLQWQAAKTLKVATDYAIAEVVKPGTSLTDVEYRLLPNAKSGAGPVKCLKQSVAYTDFTDDGSTSGHLDLTPKLAAGALVVGWRADVSTGFTGDTTAVLKIGDTSVTDRFSAVTTTSVLAAGVVGCNVKASVSPFATAETTVRLTVTGGADFTSISAGAMVVEVYYIETAAFN